MNIYLRRIVDFVLTITVAVIAGAAAAWLARGLELPEWLGAPGLVVDAVTGALGSGLTVYLITVTVVVEELKATVMSEIADGFMGKLDIPKLAYATDKVMTRLPYLRGADASHHFHLEPIEKFLKELSKHDTKNYSAIALSLVPGASYTADDFVNASRVLSDRFGAKFRHIIVLDADRKNIRAASDRQNTNLVSAQLESDLNLVRVFLDLLSREDRIGWLELFGFATVRFKVQQSARMLFSDFCRAKASEALLEFDGATVVGSIKLWQLVELALGKPVAEDIASTADSNAAM